MNAAVLVFACVGSAIALGIGLRGRRVGRTPSCAACGYELGEQPPSRCSECGAALGAPGAVVRGQRRPYRLAAAAGGGFLLLSLVAAGLFAWGGLTGPAMARLKPTGWLLREIGTVRAGEPWPHRPEALSEFRERLATGRISGPQVSRLLDQVLVGDPSTIPKPPAPWVEITAGLMGDPGVDAGSSSRVREWVLERQADRDAPWDGRWGAALEDLRHAGRLEDAAWDRYLSAMVNPALVVESLQARRGETIPVSFSLGARGGGVWGIRALVEVQLEPGARQAAQPPARLVMDCGHGSILWQPMLAATERIGMATLPEEPGEAAVHAVALVTLFKRRGGLDPLLDPPEPLAPPRRFEVARPVTVAAGGEPLAMVRVRPDESLRAAVEGSLRRVGRPRAVRTERGTLVRGGLMFAQPPVDLAFDVVWRDAAGREWGVGWLLCERDEGAFYREYGAILEGFDAGSVDVVLRPSPGPLRRHARVREVWGGEIVLPARAVKWGPQATDEP